LNLKNEHEEWLKRQNGENEEWNQERADFKSKISQLQGQLQESKNKNKSLEDSFNKKLEDKNLQIASLQGKIE
jgi:hypothetical protein